MSLHSVPLHLGTPRRAPRRSAVAHFRRVALRYAPFTVPAWVCEQFRTQCARASPCAPCTAFGVTFAVHVNFFVSWCVWVCTTQKILHSLPKQAGNHLYWVCSPPLCERFAVNTESIKDAFCVILYGFPSVCASHYNTLREPSKNSHYGYTRPCICSFCVLLGRVLNASVTK